MVSSSEAQNSSRGGSERNHRLNYASMLGWTLSLVLHVVVIFGISRIWWNNDGGGNAAEVEVGLILEQSATIGFEEGGGISISSEETELSGMKGLAQVWDNFKEISPSFPEVHSDFSFTVNVANESTSPGDGDWDAFSGRGGVGGAGGASFFGLEVRGNKFIYVVDRSGSMKAGRLARAKGELVRSINELDDKMEFMVIFYSEGYTVMPAKKPVKASGDNKRLCFNAIERINADGGTEPAGAMLKALSFKPDAIWLLSDGKFNVRIVSEITKGNADRRTSINTIAFLAQEGEEVLKKIADSNKGRYRFVSR